MGDKTQLATLSAASEGASRWVVFAAAALALIATSAIGAGEAVSRVPKSDAAAPRDGGAETR